MPSFYHVSGHYQVLQLYSTTRTKFVYQCAVLIHTTFLYGYHLIVVFVCVCVVVVVVVVVAFYFASHSCPVLLKLPFCWH